MSAETASRPVATAPLVADDPAAQGGGVAKPPFGALQVIGHSGLFDCDFYLGGNPDLAGLGSEALSHYHNYGWREGRKPNLYFDPRWYLSQYPDVAAACIDPLLHYIARGETAGNRPIAWFDPLWYLRTYAVPDGMLGLRHFLLHRADGAVSALPEFDAGFYLRAYPDVAAAGLDPLEHYMVQGFREARRPFEGFDPAFYRKRYLRHDNATNPLLHYLSHRDDPEVHPALPRNETSIPREMRRTTQPGAYFEPVRPLPSGAARRVQMLAYYLPQFHAVKQNDEWWGEGFTEWTNVARGLPRFAGHYQPRIPRDLGHYSLTGVQTMRRQAEMARNAGIAGFVFYFYWFNGTRLLDAPLEALLADRSIDMPFCLMWANENWTRRWDGSEHDILISQDFRAEDEPAMIDCFGRHFADPRYIRLQGRPLLMIYRAGLVPDTKRTIGRWRELFMQRCGEDPIFLMSQAFGDSDPRPFGIDGAIEFPPHKVVDGLATINAQLDLLDTEFTAQVYDYDQIVERSLAAAVPDFPLVRTACPSWDNDARRQGSGLVMHGSTPAKYQAWLEGLMRQALAHPFFGSAIVCINAWNEWAEGAYLEPDLHHGAAYLNATARAVSGYGAATRPGRILLVGHDAFQAGAQSLLLHVGRQLARAHGVEISFLLLAGGPMLEGYQAIGPTRVLAADDPALPGHLERLRRDGFDNAIVNSAASGAAGARLHAADIGFALLVHELPAVIAEKHLQPPLAAAAALARIVVFPATVVQNAVGRLLAIPDARTRLLPQGLYRDCRYSARMRLALRARIGIPKDDLLLVGMGYGDLRKGFDLFLQLWRTLQVPAQVPARSRARCGQRVARVHCLWLGDLDPSLRLYLQAELDLALASGRFHLPGHVQNAPDYLSAADAFVLTSREDPLPSVVMEAMAAGLSCVAFAGSGGIPELIEQHGGGALAPLGDLQGMAGHALALAARTHAQSTAARAAAGRRAAARFDFAAYVASLMALAQPALPRISVVVPSYNYARYMKQRLASILAQTQPVLEVIVLDDASTDDSVAVARAAAAEWNRDVRVVAAQRNSGSVFRQWHRAATEARGDWVWIAEADDAAEPLMLERLVQAMQQACAIGREVTMVFCDSQAIDEEGTLTSDSYKPYFATTAGTTLDQDGLHEGADFVRDCLSERNLILNASGVLFSREALRQALAACGEELFAFRMAGDWRLYIEMLRAPGARIAYVAAPLNIHRRHARSATHRLAGQKHLGEVARIHRLVGRGPSLLDADRTRQRTYRDQLARQLGLRVLGE
ncbi:glycoside hydrolase family 99-like domain-containing protein [Lichenicoccus sp.]|uniref:glycoside hydrolase family 99-like domain-containing protein n=1 Tax=Lichenicoccus sp. TaxID=2781899 RepID=UPI003D11376F